MRWLAYVPIFNAFDFLSDAKLVRLHDLERGDFPKKNRDYPKQSEGLEGKEILKGGRMEGCWLYIVVKQCFKRCLLG